ncbi:MAG: hypothetical protein WBA18_15465 [Terracidiphilus sp.]
MKQIHCNMHQPRKWVLSHNARVLCVGVEVSILIDGTEGSEACSKHVPENLIETPATRRIAV